MKKSFFKKNKGQSVMFDLLLAIIILIFIVELNALSWNRSVNQARLKQRRSEMETFALGISDMLIKQPGYPNDWENYDSAETMGLASEDHVLDTDKVNDFLSLSQDTVKDLLGIADYDFLFRIRALNKTILMENGTQPSSNSEIVNVRRLVLYDNQTVYMEFMIWE